MCVLKRLLLKINYNSKKFSVFENSENGELSTDLIFEYKQNGNVLTCNYQGGEVVSGHLLGNVDNEGNIEMLYHQINTKGELKSGKCFSKPEITKNGKIKLHESWEWMTGNKSKGESVLIEI